MSKTDTFKIIYNYRENKGSKRKSHHDESQKEDERVDDDIEESTRLMTQPSMLVGGTLQTHQMDSLNWMISLYDMRLNGILADDMVSSISS